MENNTFVSDLLLSCANCEKYEKAAREHFALQASARRPPQFRSFPETGPSGRHFVRPGAPFWDHFEWFLDAFSESAEVHDHMCFYSYDGVRSDPRSRKSRLRNRAAKNARKRPQLSLSFLGFGARRAFSGPVQNPGSPQGGPLGVNEV